jgi:hypothetical protein
MAVDLAKISGAVEIQHTITGGQIASADIQANAIKSLASTASKTAIALQTEHDNAVLSGQAAIIKQISDVGSHSKHASQDYTALAPIIALEVGSPAAGSLGQSNASTRVAASNTTSAAISTGGSVVTKLFQGLFA